MSVRAEKRAHSTFLGKLVRLAEAQLGNGARRRRNVWTPCQHKQLQVSSLNLLFTPQPLGAFLSDISRPPKLGQLLWLLHRMLSQDGPTFYLLEVQHHRPNSDRVLLAHASRTGQQITAQQSSDQHPHLIYCMFGLIQISSFLICCLMFLSVLQNSICSSSLAFCKLNKCQIQMN